VAWTTPPVYSVGQLLTAVLMNNVSGDLSDLDSRTRPTGATVGTTQSTTSTSYTDLATVGPAVTITTGTTAMVAITSVLSTGAASQTPLMAFAVSGASTAAANDAQALRLDQAASQNLQATALYLVSGLTAGANTFTAKYRTSAGTAAFNSRDVIAWPANNLS
jgi:hypothetical protein